MREMNTIAVSRTATPSTTIGTKYWGISVTAVRIFKPRYDMKKPMNKLPASPM